MRQIGGAKEIYVPDPSWGNHQHIFRSAGLQVKTYSYLSWATGTTLDFGAMRCALSSDVPRGGAVLLHACAHNPTGVDPTAEQWAELAALFRERGLVALFDSAYQGYASGDLDADAAAVRAFEAEGVLPIVCQSYAKSMGLYGERIGAVNFVCSSAEEADAVMSQVKQRIIRPHYSSPPLHGARLACTVLSDAKLFSQWCTELLVMATRVQCMRATLADELRRVRAPAPDGGDWGHITSQIGMFAFTGLSAAHVDALRAHHHIYLTRDGRMSMAAMKPGDVEYIAASMRDVLCSL
uniref:Aspartate aminotransferase n=1 Tax=Calcidiscus leptoporus TaxID=127549 RepID=A0A7S0J568_9EUKA